MQSEKQCGSTGKVLSRCGIGAEPVRNRCGAGAEALTPNPNKKVPLFSQPSIEINKVWYNKRIMYPGIDHSCYKRIDGVIIE